MNTYCLSVTSTEVNEVAMFPCARSDGRSVHLLVENLRQSTLYSLSIISDNNSGRQQ